ncbi:MAG: hypothetical protein E7484_00945 [Ruminococcaceae bacterium]|nr:hypothetical protein [Oscillospiraceae bacterium]
MISKQMYKILSNIPLPTDAIHYEQLFPLCELSENTFRHLLIQARGKYIFAPTIPIEDAIIALTDLGVAEVEEYEAREENKKIVDDSLTITQESLKVSKVAMWVSIISALIAVISLIKMFVQ